MLLFMWLTLISQLSIYSRPQNFVKFISQLQWCDDGLII